jgi:hypothetical protein
MDANGIGQANGTIRRCRFVKMDTADSNGVLEADANEKTVGISDIGTSDDGPTPSVTADPSQVTAGKSVLVHTLGKTCQLEAGSGGFSAGDDLKSDADGKGVVAASTGTTVQRIGAHALTAAAAGELGWVIVVYAAVRPALS